MASFAAVDFETANEARASACAVGVVRVEEGETVEAWASLIDPETEFSGMNIMIHGIRPEDVSGAPTFPEVLTHMLATTAHTEAVVAHSAAFDIQVLTDSARRYGLDVPETPFACTRVFSRHWWPGWPSYALPYVLSQLDLYDSLGGSQHHDALWDARAAAAIAQRGLMHCNASTWAQACEALPVRLGTATRDVYRGCVTRSSGYSISPVRDPDVTVDPTHPLLGLRVCFTGTLSLYRRREAAQKVVDAGGEFSPSVTRHTDLLVVGEQDLAKLAGHSESSKMRKASELASAGHPVEIIDEVDFYCMLSA